MEKAINVIGGGLAGVEASLYLANHGYKVNLFEQKPLKMSPAHHSNNLGELVCSNSLKSKKIDNACGLLKEEMKYFGSIMMEASTQSEVPAGNALSVDRELFSEYITNKIKNHPNIEVVNEELTEIPEGPVICASGPLTSDDLSKCIGEFIGKDYLYFFDAVAPILLEESINKDKAYLKSRYDKGEACYYNCPMNEEEFKAFYNELVKAERVIPKDFELKVFEGCMAVEDMASRGEQTLLFGPLKPVGLRHPVTGETPYAVVQLRQDNASKTLYNIVGFQTHLKWAEQKRVFRMIPGLENAEFVRYGVMHKNTYINSPGVLNKYYQTIKREDLFFAGQITGVEGYLESASSGMVCGINMYNYLMGKPLIDFTRKTSIGSLANYISTFNLNFQPMNANHGLFDPIEGRFKKVDRKMEYARRALEKLDEIIGDMNG